MKSLEAFKQELRDLLIELDGDIILSDYPNIISDAKEAGLNQTQLSKLLIEIDSTIPWNNIRKGKEEAERKAAELKEEAEKKQEAEHNAGETLQFIIEQCALDGLFTSQEIRVYFETSANLNQDENKSVKLLKDYFTNNNYIPLITPSGTSIKTSLESTDWYKDKLPPPPPDKLPPIQQALLEIFKRNESKKLLKTDISSIYLKYYFEKVDFIEKNINDFINNNNLVPENDKLEGKSYKEKQCSTNWTVKNKPAIVFPPPGCGKYLGYGILLALIAIGIYYGLPLLNSGTAYYNISSSANIRSTPNKSSTGNAIAELKYGEVFKSSKSVSDGSGTIWYKSNSWFTDEYVSSKLMVNEKDFYLLESIFGDEITKNTILTFKPRKALIDYYKRQDPEYKFFGKIDDITYKKVYGKPKDFTGEWQVFCYDFVDRVPNSIIYPRAFNSKSNFTDFGFIVTNVSANIKRFVLYTFDDITEEPIYVGEADATGHNLVIGVKVRGNGTLDVNYADY